MPWQEVTAVSLREEFVMLAGREDANIRELCRRYGISAKTGYKWLGRYREAGVEGLHDRPRRPKSSPARTPRAVEERVLQLRAADPQWGGRKIQRVMIREGDRLIPAASTITEILRRHGELDPSRAGKSRDFQSFEHPQPNDLWQMDFKGHFALERGGRCHPLTVLDDHSRFALGLEACGDETGQTVRRRLGGIFRRYGLPRRMLMDNGPPWGSPGAHPYTAFKLWLIRLGIQVSHPRPFHPQTQGKDERFHRTMKAELLQYRHFDTLEHCQPHFDRWRHRYNTYRPHDSLGLEVPASRYSPSPRPFPASLPPIEYAADDHVRKVQDNGCISFRGRLFKVAKAFHGYPVALRPTNRDGYFEVFFCNQQVGEIELRSTPPTSN